MLASALQFLVRMKLSGFFLSRLSWNHKRSVASVIPVDNVSQGKGGLSLFSSKGSWVSPCLNISQRERAEGLVTWWWFQDAGCCFWATVDMHHWQIPDELAEHYLSRSGFQCPDIRV
jgi:hypothetical protein